MAVSKQVILISISVALAAMVLLVYSASVAEANYRPARRDNRDYRLLNQGDPKPGALNLTEIGLVKGEATSIIVLPDCNSCNLLSVEKSPRLEPSDSLLFLTDASESKRTKELAVVHGAKLVQFNPTLHGRLNSTFSPRLYRFAPDGTLTFIQKQPLSWGELVAEYKRLQKL